MCDRQWRSEVRFRRTALYGGVDRDKSGYQASAHYTC